ncbi:MAG: YggS family pyridoxal phosphate-dependent enzyme [Alphaproteobacteria bacterium]
MTINFKILDQIKSNLKKFDKADLLIVSKNQTSNDVEELINQGFKIFGENRVQEASKKFGNIVNIEKIELHLIGPLQTNKVKDALILFNTIQSIDRKKLVDAIAKVSTSLKNKKTNYYYIQVNIGSETQKSGVSQSDVADLYRYAIDKGLKVIGLMCIPPIGSNSEIFFKEMNAIKNKINPKLFLSMGMSNDYLVALNHKSNLIRVGSLIFND